MTTSQEYKPFSAQKWKDKFNRKPRPDVHAMRIEIMQGIWNAFRELKYSTEEGHSVQLNKDELLAALKRGKMYNSDHKFTPSPKCSQETIIEVKQQDCLEVAYELKFGKSLNPVVLNMANANTAGGGYKHGDGAQEENLHRRSNYYQHLDDPDYIYKERPWRYPVQEFGAIYSSDVTVIRGSESDGYPFIRPYAMSMIACAAYCRPWLVFKNGQSFLDPDVAEATKRKIRTILRVGLDNGHDAIVLSAFGCGAFRNPAAHMASLFKEISFAILDDHNTGKQHNPKGNFQPFVDVFVPLNE